MELGFAISVFDIDGGTTAIAGELARVGAAAEEAGATWLAVMDHYFQIEPTGLPAEANMLEGYTTLGYLAAHTSTVTLGVLVTGVTYRHPWPMCDLTWLTIRGSEGPQAVDLRFCFMTGRKVCTKSGPGMHY